MTRPVAFPCFGVLKKEKHILLPSVSDVVIEQGTKMGFDSSCWVLLSEPECGFLIIHVVSTSAKIGGSVVVRPRVQVHSCPRHVWFAVSYYLMLVQFVSRLK